jgi:hypothetical protein
MDHAGGVGHPFGTSVGMLRRVRIMNGRNPPQRVNLVRPSTERALPLEIPGYWETGTTKISHFQEICGLFLGAQAIKK